MSISSQRCRAALLLLIIAVVAVGASSTDAANTVVKFEISNVGTTIIDDFYVRLLDNDAPDTVQNFLRYANEGIYDGSFFHRLAYDFMLQGGTYRYNPLFGIAEPLTSYDPIDNEFGHSNVRGTLAMTKLPGEPHSATKGFFVNLSDNNDPADPPGNLDALNGGSTVFAYVIGDGMDVVDQLAAYPPNPLGVQIHNAGSPPFEQLPLIPDGAGLYFETLTSISVVGVDGDVDFDGDVDIDDYNGFTASFGQRGLGLAADFDGDEDVDLDDFAVLRAGFDGPATSPPAAFGGAVPEPAGICLLGLCGMAMIARRRRKS